MIMKNKILAFGICTLMLLVVFSSGCIDFGGEEKGTNGFLNISMDPWAQVTGEYSATSTAISVYHPEGYKWANITWLLYDASTGAVETGAIFTHYSDIDSEGYLEVGDVVKVTTGKEGTFNVKAIIGGSVIYMSTGFIITSTTGGVYALSTGTWSDAGSTINASVISTTPSSGIKVADITWQLTNLTSGAVSSPGTAVCRGVTGLALATTEYLTAGCNVGFAQPTVSGDYKIKAIVGGSQVYESATFSFTLYCIDTVVQIETNKGTIKIGLYDDTVPATVNNFIKYVNDSFYDGLIFHRVINDFMIQGGSFYPNLTQKMPTYPPINLEINPELIHVDGAVAMARTSDLNSATSQFYICDGAQPHLDGNYAVFGQVIEGMDVVRSIASVQTHTENGMENVPVEDVIIISVTISEYK